MYWSGGGEEISATLVNAALLALWPVLPALLAAYVRLSLATRRLPPKFELRKSEAVELDRAVTLYQDVRGRLGEVSRGMRSPGLWQSLFGRTADTPTPQGDELDDLAAYAQHLRATITRLTGRPLQRLRAWVRLKSTHFALGQALATYAVGFALLILTLYVVEQAAWADEFGADPKRLAWYPLDPRLFYANAVATGFAVLAAPLFYGVRWLALCSAYSLEFALFKDLAKAGITVRVDPGPEESHEPLWQAGDADPDTETDWVGVLGLSPAASVDEIKEAYKALIKQNHPDRVHNMSPSFKVLAEAETKKINAAYREALLSVPSL